MPQNFPIRQIELRFKRVMLYAPVLLGNDAVNFFKDSFRRQGWLGDSFQPWKPRKNVTKWGKTPRNNGRAILVDTGRLRRSIRLISASNLTAVVGTDVPYARAHNEGVRLGLIMNVQQHTRKLTKFGITHKTELKTRTKIKFGRVQTGETIVQAHKRRIDQRIPQRQFMGQSPYLTKQLQRRFTAELMKSLR